MLILEIIDEYSNNEPNGLLILSVIKDHMVVPIITNKGKGMFTSVVSTAPLALKKIQTTAVVSDGTISHIKPMYEVLYLAVNPLATNNLER